MLTALGDAPAELIQSTAFLGEADTDLARSGRRGRRSRRRSARWRSPPGPRCATPATFAGTPPRCPASAPRSQGCGEERAPRPRTDAQLLAALAAGPRDAAALFAANQAAEEAPFLGDTWCFARLYALAEAGLVAPVDGPMPLPPPRGDHDSLRGATAHARPGKEPP